MKRKPVIPRVQAIRDVDDAIAYYLGEGAPQAALGIVDALDTPMTTSPAIRPQALSATRSS